MERKVSGKSDEGYESDLSSPTRAFTREELRVINREAKEFKENFFVEKLLNNSANGVIYTGHRKSDLKPVCIKQIPKTRITVWSKLNGRVLPKELKMHLQAQEAPGVVNIYDFYERKSSFVIVMERPNHSVDIFELSKTYGAIHENPAKIIFRQIVETCKTMQNLGVLHRDLKDENILINKETLEIKIIDFTRQLSSALLHMHEKRIIHRDLKVNCLRL